MVKTKKNMTSPLDSFESDTEKEYDVAMAAASGQKKSGGSERATALVSMTKEEKER